MKRLFYTFCLPLLVPVLLLGIWHYFTPIIDNNMILPPVHKIWDILTNPTEPLLSMGSLIQNVAMSFVRVAIAFAVAAVLGILLGVAMGYSPRLDRLLSNFIELFRPMPPMAWVPLMLAWTGLFSLAAILHISAGPLYPYIDSIKISMLFIIFIGGFFPILTSTYQGVRSVPVTFLDAARVLGAKEADIFCKILLPGSAPGIFNGLRIGLALSWSCLISSEMLPGSLSGVGYLIIHAYSMGRVDIVIAGMLCIGATGALLDWIFRIIELRKLSWARQAR